MLSVIIPVYNEEEILERSVLTLSSLLSTLEGDYEVLVADNGSTDGTAAVARRLAEQYPWLRFFSLPERGPGRAFVRMAAAARGEYLISLDIDLSAGLEFLRYAPTLLQYCDMVVGSKTYGRQRRSLLRVSASGFYVTCAQWLFDLTCSDYSMGYKAFRKETIVAALNHLDGWTGYIFELVLYLTRRQRKIVQVSVDCDDRRRSHFRLLHEGFYRFGHLYRCWKLLRDPAAWLNKDGG